MRKALIAFKRVCLLLAVLLSLSTIALSQDDAQPTEQGEVEGLDYAPVILDGVELFLVAGFSALPAEERAVQVTEFMIEVAEASDSSNVSVVVKKEEFGFAIYADGIRVTLVTDLDADIDEMDANLLASVQADTIKEAIINYRVERSDEGRIRSVTEALILTVLFSIFCLLIFRGQKYAYRWVTKRVNLRLSGVKKATGDLVRSEAVESVAIMTVKLASLCVTLIALYYYLSNVLFSFAETRSIATLLLSVITEPAYSVLKAGLNEIPSLVTLLVIYFVTRYLIKVVHLIFIGLEGGSLKFEGFEEQWIWPTYNIVRGLVIIFACVLAFPYLPGSGSEAFKGAAVVLGVMMSLGSSSVVGNLLAGIFIIYKRSTNIGDRIKVGEHIGDVVSIKLMESHLKSIKNELISIPNSQLLNSEVINYSTRVDGRGLLLHTTVGIGYEEPQEKIEKLLVKAARRTTNLKKSPPPFVLRTALTDYAVNYQINAFTTRGSFMQKILSDLHGNILDVFNEAGVQIMTPSYIADPPEPKIAPVSEKPATVKKSTKK